MNTLKSPAETYSVTIRQADPGDSPGVVSLLAQMPQWGSAAPRLSRNQGFVAVDDQDCIVGWLSGHHDSFAWENVPDYNMSKNWHCSFIQWLLVDKDCRSAAIGASLMRRFALESSDAGRDTIIASPQAGENERALLEFYYRLGYRRASSGHLHRGPWGQQEHFPLPETDVGTGDWHRSLSAETQAILRGYRESLGQ